MAPNQYSRPYVMKSHSRLSHEGSTSPCPPPLCGHPGTCCCPLSPSQMPWVDSQSHDLHPGQSAALRWVLGHQNCSFFCTELILLAGPHLLYRLRPAFLCVPWPHLPLCSESTLKGCYSASLSSGDLSHCKPTPSLNRNCGVFETISKSLLLAQD